MIADFIGKFTKERVVDDENVYQVGDEWYLVQPALFKLGKDLPRQPVFVGTLLGRKKNDYLVPGVELLRLLAARRVKKAHVNDKAAWLFVCGKNVLAESIAKTEHDPKPGDWVLVVNNGDCLGFGTLEGDVIENLFDIGDFLRRERVRTKSGNPRTAIP